MKTTRMTGFWMVLLAGAALLAAPQADASNTMADVWARTVIHEDGSKTVSTRDSNSQIIEAKTFDTSDKLVMKRIFQIDARGNSKRGFIFDGDNNLIYRVGFTYDEIDRLKETTLFDSNGNVVSRQLHSFDANGKELPPRLVNFSGRETEAGQIRPAAALAKPGSDEQVLQGVTPQPLPELQRVASEQEATTSSGEKKKGFFSRFRSKK